MGLGTDQNNAEEKISELEYNTCALCRLVQANLHKAQREKRLGKTKTRQHSEPYRMFSSSLILYTCAWNP